MAMVKRVAGKIAKQVRDKEEAKDTLKRAKTARSRIQKELGEDDESEVESK